MLSQAMLFAERDPGLPAIHAVVLEFDGTNLIAAATDRFKLIAIRYRIETPDTGQEVVPFKMTLPIPQVKLLLTHLKTPPAWRFTRHVTVDIGGSNALDVQDVLAPNIFNITNADAKVSVVVEPVASRLAQFPDWKPLFAEPEPGLNIPAIEGVHAIALAAHNMETFFKLAKLRTDNRFHGTLRFRFSDSVHKVVVNVDDDCAGIVMPVRMDDPPSNPQWLTRTDSGTSVSRTGAKGKKSK